MVKTGPYKIVRHPSYTGGAVGYIALAIFLQMQAVMTAGGTPLLAAALSTRVDTILQRNQMAPAAWRLLIAGSKHEGRLLRSRGRLRRHTGKAVRLSTETDGLDTASWLWQPGERACALCGAL